MAVRGITFAFPQKGVRRMALFLVSYDLNKPEKDYPKLINY
jgi:hypothetical protein